LDDAAAGPAACGRGIAMARYGALPGGRPKRRRPPTREEGINASGQGAGTGADTALPGDVQQLFENRCITCHLGPPGPSPFKVRVVRGGAARRMQGLVTAGRLQRLP